MSEPCGTCNGSGIQSGTYNTDCFFCAGTGFRLNLRCTTCDQPTCSHVAALLAKQAIRLEVVAQFRCSSRAETQRVLDAIDAALALRIDAAQEPSDLPLGALPRDRTKERQIIRRSEEPPTEPCQRENLGLGCPCARCRKDLEEAGGRRVPNAPQPPATEEKP